MAHAICFECGTPKRDWGDKCPQCSLDPRRDHESFAKSYILSTDRCDAGNDPDEQLGLPELDEFQLDKDVYHADMHANGVRSLQPRVGAQRLPWVRNRTN